MKANHKVDRQMVMADKGLLLITGSSGFLGSHAARKALEMGYHVRGFDTKPPIVEGIEHVTGDIRDHAAVVKAMKGVDKVLHLAACTANTEFIKDKKTNYEINVNGFLNVIEAAREAGVERFAYASSAATYLWDTGQFHEDAVIDVKKQRNHYSKSKLMNEMKADSYRDDHGMAPVGLRFFNIYGTGENEKGDYASIITQFIGMKLQGKPLVVYGDGSQARDFIHVEDAAKLALIALEEGKHPVYNVGTGKTISYDEIANLIDKEHKAYVTNPYKAYQMLTRADTKRLRELAPDFVFADVREMIPRMVEERLAREIHSPPQNNPANSRKRVRQR